MLQGLQSQPLTVTYEAEGECESDDDDDDDEESISPTTDRSCLDTHRSTLATPGRLHAPRGLRDACSGALQSIQSQSSAGSSTGGTPSHVASRLHTPAVSVDGFAVAA